MNTKYCISLRMLLFPLSMLTLFMIAPPAFPQANTALLSGWMDWSDPANMLARYLNNEALGLLDGRAGRVQALTTRADWEKRQNEIRAALYRIVGPFPERTPLNARITGTVLKDDFRVEKIVFESRPGFFVTGALFLPGNLSGNAPAILNPIGHTAEAFRHPLYQDLILNLVHKGFIVFSYDPPGQGERLQYYNPETGNSDVGGSTAEHSYAGFQCFLTGSNIARYMIWDGMRALDYLLTRPEVDGSRIGVTGLSGGGTQSSYLGAFDERILAAAPTCYITGFRRLLTSIGPQDAEQNFPAGIKNGIDHADLLEIRAPKPTLLVATTRDFFSIQGARETAAEVEKAFAAFGQEGRFSIAEDDFEHGYTAATREAIFRFFQEALSLPGEPTDRKYPYLTYEELRVTPTGQVKTAFGSKNIFDLNRSDAIELLSGLDASRNNADSHLGKIPGEAMRLSGFRLPAENQPAVFRGRDREEGYFIEKYVLDGGEGIPIPILLFLPESVGPHPSVIYCDSRGKSRDADIF